jgi:hypothetical protein
MAEVQQVGTGGFYVEIILDLLKQPDGSDLVQPDGSQIFGGN